MNDDAVSPAIPPQSDEKPPGKPEPRGPVVLALVAIGVTAHAFMLLTLLLFGDADMLSIAPWAIGAFVAYFAFVVACFVTGRRRLAIWVSGAPFPIMVVLSIALQAVTA